MVELKTHAAQLGWNTCNPSLLSGFAFCWHIYFKHPPFFNSSAWLAMNHTHEHTHVSCHDYSHSFHHKTYSFPLAVNPVNCYVVCYMDSLICFVNLNFFFYVFRLQCLHWPNIQPRSFSTIFVMFIFRFILFMFGSTCANIPLPSISLVVIIVSAQNGSMSCQTHALHCMLISHGLLYMVMSKGLHVTDVDVFFIHVTGLCVAYIGLVSVG